MAKVHVNKALQLNPKDERALKCKQYIDQQAQKSAGGKQTTPPPKSSAPDKPKPSDKPEGGGLFGGLFGGKKK